jgi:hypothetical protein
MSYIAQAAGIRPSAAWGIDLPPILLAAPRRCSNKAQRALHLLQLLAAAPGTSLHIALQNLARKSRSLLEQSAPASKAAARPHVSAMTAQMWLDAGENRSSCTSRVLLGGMSVSFWRRPNLPQTMIAETLRFVVSVVFVV